MEKVGNKTYYVYKIDADKHRKYNREYYAKHKQRRHERYLEFKATQKWYYERRATHGEAIPFRYLTYHDKQQITKKQKYEEEKRGFFKKIFGGGNHGQ